MSRKKFKSLTLKIICFTLLSYTGGKANNSGNCENACQYFENRLTYEVTPETVNGWMHDHTSPEEFVILDVRDEKDYQAGHVPGAVNMPYEKYNSFLDEKMFPELKKEILYIVICYGGECNKSHEAARNLSSLGYNVKKLIGGFSHWEKQGYPVEA